jgi:hypothetical protein
VQGLDAYKMPGRESITLPNTKVTFGIELPTQWNRPYNRAWQEAISENGAMENGSFVVKGLSAIAFQEAQISAFITHCVKDMPEGMTAELLAGDYYPAAETLFRIATARASEVEERAKAQTGK